MALFARIFGADALWSSSACYAMCCFPDENFKMPDKLYPKLAELLGAYVETRTAV